MNPDPYKGLFGGAHCRDSPVQTLRPCICAAGTCSASEAYLEQFDETFKYSLPKGGQVAAFFAESIQVKAFFWPTVWEFADFTTTHIFREINLKAKSSDFLNTNVSSSST